MIYSMFLAAVVLAAQVPQKPGSAAETPLPADLPPALRIAADKLNAGPVSPLFEALGKRKDDASAVGLSKKQLELILKMDEAARASLRHWLTRSRPKDSASPKLEDLDSARAFVVGHLEAIVFEGVLTPDQSDERRKLAMKPVMPLRQGRYTLIPELFPPDRPYPETRRGYLIAILGLAQEQDFWGNDGCTDVFRLILDRNYVRKWGTLPDLTTDQTNMTKKLDAVARDAQKLWLLRGVSGFAREHPLPPEQSDLQPTPAMISRLSESGQRLRASLASHTEEILLDVVLDPAQRIELKRRLWTKLGGRSLLDPELASTLKLAKWQIQTISLMLEDRAVLWMKSKEIYNTQHFGFYGAKDRGLIDEKQAQKGTDDAWLSHGQRLADFDVRIWDVLSTSQSRTLAKILGKPVAKKPAAKTKKTQSRVGRDPP